MLILNMFFYLKFYEIENNGQNWVLLYATKDDVR